MDVNTMRLRFGEKIGALQRELHRHPERSSVEYRTTERIRAAMGGLELEERGIGMPTGAAFRLCTGRKGPVICLRADIDGLPVQEAESHEERSEEAGMMHACGHDVHAAGLYGAALALCAERESLGGDVIFLFQPSEESEEMGQGAEGICKSGFFAREGISAAFGLHNMPSMPIGTIGVGQGPVMAAKDSFRISIQGRGGHGAMPEQCCDPIVAAAAVVMALQPVVSRGISPLDAAVVTVSAIHGGDADNVIGDGVSMGGSIRSLQPEARSTVIRRMEEIVQNCSAAYGCIGEIRFTSGVPATINAPELVEIAEKAAGMTAEAAHVLRAAPVMISEDFAYYGQRLPAFFYFLGSGMPGRENAPLHSADFCAHPDTALYGACLLANTALAGQAHF